MGQGPERPLTTDKKESLWIALQGQGFSRFKMKDLVFCAMKVTWPHQTEIYSIMYTKHVSISEEVFAWYIESIQGRISGKAR